MSSLQITNRSSFVRTRGFSLLEVVVVAGIVATVAALGWQAYSKNILENRRKDGVRALMQADHAMQQCKSDFGIYANCVLVPNPKIPPDREQPYVYNNNGGNSTVASWDNLYSINIVTTAIPDGYTLTATKILADDPECLTLTLDSVGNKGFTFVAGTYPSTVPDYHHCWGG